MPLGIFIDASSDAASEHLAFLDWLQALGLGAALRVEHAAGGTRYRLHDEVAARVAPDADTLTLTERLPELDLTQEILWSLLASPIALHFPSHAEFHSAVRVRMNIVRAAQRTSMDFHTSEADRPPEHWVDDPERGFLLRPGASLIEALELATQPDASGHLYAFSCYRATEYVILLAVAQEARDHHPALLEGLTRQWERRAIKSGLFHDVFLREHGTQDQPLPMHWYIPGDRVWFRNPDDRSSDVPGYEGSWVIYLGRGRFSNFWEHVRPYDVPGKCLEIFHWRHGARVGDDGELWMDESVVAERVRASLALPDEAAAICARMRCLRDPKGVYQDGGCMDTTREVPRWVGRGHCEIVLPDA